MPGGTSYITSLEAAEPQPLFTASRDKISSWKLALP